MAQTPLDFSLDWSYAWSSNRPQGTGVFRRCPDDFRVDEVLGFELSGDGEHVFLQIEKVGQNTLWVIKEMARQLGIEQALFGRSGMKDRHAITTQWISVQNPNCNLKLENLDIPGVQVLQVGRHQKKLRPGMHLANQFRLQLKELTVAKEQTESILRSIQAHGFPNYFGEQRFGFDGQNLQRGWELLESRRLTSGRQTRSKKRPQQNKKGIYLSALRSFLFNKVLEARVKDGFSDTPDAFDLTGPMWGRGRPQISALQQAYEQKVLQNWEPLCHALEYSGLNQERRPLMLTPNDLHWEWCSAEHLNLAFGLPSGAYATSLIRELGNIVDGVSHSRQLNHTESP